MTAKEIIFNTNARHPIAHGLNALANAVQERLAKLVGGVRVIKVGAASETDRGATGELGGEHRDAGPDGRDRDAG